MDRLGKNRLRRTYLLPILVQTIILADKFGTLKKIKELSSYTNAAMGLSIPLSIGAAVASQNQQFYLSLVMDL